MSSSKAATARRSPSRSRRSPAVPATVHSEPFAAHGRTYRWREGAGVVAPNATLADPARRPSLPGFFTRTLVPQLERRGARGLVFIAQPADGLGADEVRWIAWRAQGDKQPAWGLFMASRRLGESAPANDAFTLVAWGDGPALAWADEREAARTALRAALRLPPPWLVRGMQSGDPTFPVRFERVAGAVSGSGAPCVAVVRPGASTVASTGPTAPATLMDIVQSWKRTHPGRAS